MSKQNSKIDFKTSLPKTIYTDIVGMPNPLLLGLTIHYYNHSDGILYMQITGSGVGWSSGSVDLGALNSGSNDYANLDNFMSRVIPVAATNETIVLTLNGYSDSGYTTLAYTFSRSVSVIFIKSDDGTWTTDNSDNFDDGTVDGWAVVYESGNWFSYPTLIVSTDFVISTPYSLCMTQHHSGANVSAYIHKSFTTSARNTAYAIVDIRIQQQDLSPYAVPKYIDILYDSTILIHLGKTLDGTSSVYTPVQKWFRVVVPLLKSTTLSFKIRVCGRSDGASIILYMDNFRIISK